MNTQAQASPSENANFIVGLSAAVLALYPFKDLAQSISLSLFSWELSLFELAGIFLALLLLSAYLYGLNHIRYNFSYLLTAQWLQWLKYIELGAHFFYIIAFVLPLMTAVTWCLTLLVGAFNNISIDVEPFISYVAGIINVIVAILSGLVSIFFYRTRKEDVRALYEEEEKQSEAISSQSFTSGRYELTLLNLYQAVMSAINAQLINRVGIGTRRIPTRRLLEIAVKNQIIQQHEANAILDLQGVRNSIAHNLSDLYLTAEMAQRYIDLVKPILMKLKAAN